VAVPDVALVTPYPTAGQRHAGPSGVASYGANLAHALAGAGASVQVIAPHEPEAPDEPEEGLDGPVRVRRAFDRGRRGLDHAVRAARACRAPVVHLQHELFLYGGPATVPSVLPALGRLRRSGAAVVTMHQVVDPRTVDRSFTDLHRVRVPPRIARHALGGVQRSLAGLASACIVHEPPFARSVPGAVVIPHGVEHRATPPRDDARALLGLDDRLVALCFGFVAPYKGLETVLDAGRRVGADETLVVVAGGPHPRLDASGDAYASELEAAWTGPGARFTGWVPEHHVAPWFAAADVAVLAYPAPFSSSGALALALAHGTPVLVSPGMAACIDAPPAMVAPTDAVGLAERLRALRHPAARAELSAAVRPVADARRWTAVADAHLALYEQVIRR
jgi:glycosyltransferase involved in cell wall biosynthesis